MKPGDFVRDKQHPQYGVGVIVLDCLSVYDVQVRYPNEDLELVQQSRNLEIVSDSEANSWFLARIEDRNRTISELEKSARAAFERALKAGR